MIKNINIMTLFDQISEDIKSVVTGGFLRQNQE